MKSEMNSKSTIGKCMIGKYTIGKCMIAKCMITNCMNGKHKDGKCMIGKCMIVTKVHNQGLILALITLHRLRGNRKCHIFGIIIIFQILDDYVKNFEVLSIVHIVKLT